MRQGIYLNVILTVNAVLLSALLWTQLANRPLLAHPAAAQQSVGEGIPNAAAQRQRQLEVMRDIKVSVDATRKLLESGKVKVEVTNLDQIKLDHND